MTTAPTTTREFRRDVRAAFRRRGITKVEFGPVTRRRYPTGLRTLHAEVVVNGVTYIAETDRAALTVTPRRRIVVGGLTAGSNR